MESISTSAELKNHLLILETEQQARGAELRMQFSATYRNFKPYRLLANVVKEALPASNLKENMLIGGLSLVSGFLVKKMVVGKSGGLIRKIAGTALQAGASGLVARNADAIKTIGQVLYGIMSSTKKKD